MNFTKSILLLVIYSASLLIPTVVVADTDPSTFQEDKDREIARVLEKVQIAQKNLSCVQAAEDHAALKACDDAFKQNSNVPETKVKEEVTNKKVQKNGNSKEKK